MRDRTINIVNTHLIFDKSKFRFVLFFVSTYILIVCNLSAGIQTRVNPHRWQAFYLPRLFFLYMYFQIYNVQIWPNKVYVHCKCFYILSQNKKKSFSVKNLLKKYIYRLVGICLKKSNIIICIRILYLVLLSLKNIKLFGAGNLKLGARFNSSLNNVE